MSTGAISYEDICRFAGRLFLQSQYEIERQAATLSRQAELIASLREELTHSERRLAELETDREKP